MRCAIYCRISQDATLEGLGVRRQEEDRQALADSHGWTVVATFIDNDTGASSLSKKPRPQYASLLAGARAGDFEVILAYSNSRLTRRLLELEELIQLHEQRGTVINTVVSGNDDLSNADGRFAARIKASMDAAEAERTGERVRRAARQRAEQGLPKHGRYRTFGHSSDWQLVESEAAEIRDAFNRVIPGESLQSIARDWNARGVDLGNDKSVRQASIKNIVRRPLYAALATYKGDVVGKAQVEPVVSESVF